MPWRTLSGSRYPTMIQTASDVIRALQGRTLATAESCTGGMIGAALTTVPGASKVYKGGVISYWSAVKESLLGVSAVALEQEGPVSETVAAQMAAGARRALDADIAVSVTGLAGPGGDEFGRPVGTVYIGYCDEKGTAVRHFVFEGSRDEVRQQAAHAALMLILERN